MPSLVESSEPANRKFCFLLPAYNEAASISDLVLQIQEVCRSNSLNFNITIVDDGSNDHTPKIVEQLAANDSSIQIIRNSKNMGLGFSIKRGLKVISDNALPEDVIITMDADLTQEPKYITEMSKKIDSGADLVIASRYRKGSHTQGLSYHRHLLSIGASLFMLTLFPIKNVRDYSCGFRMYKSSVIKRAFLIWDDDFISETGFACMVEIAAKLKPIAKFDEIPFVLKYDEKRKPSAMKILPTVKAYLRVMAKAKRR